MTAIAEKPRPARRRPATTPKPPPERGSIKIGGREVTITHPDKVLYPKAGFTKAQVIDYYTGISPVLLPHLKNRPLTLKRYPNGVEAPFFYEKHCPSHRPDWLKTTTVWGKGKSEEIRFCLLNDLPSLVWAANLGDLELHVMLAEAGNIDCPTSVVFDLDPGAPAGLLECSEVALWMRAALEKLDLQSWVKTSGSKGLQLYVPLHTAVSYEETKAFARTLAEGLEQQCPKQVVSKMPKEARKGKVLVDWSQNDTHKTTICAYSLRAMPTPAVSTPLQWPEVEKAVKRSDAAPLSFSPSEALKRVDRHGDLFAPVLTVKQKLPKI